MGHFGTKSVATKWTNFGLFQPGNSTSRLNRPSAVILSICEALKLACQVGFNEGCTRSNQNVIKPIKIILVPMRSLTTRCRGSSVWRHLCRSRAWAPAGSWLFVGCSLAERDKCLKGGRETSDSVQTLVYSLLVAIKREITIVNSNIS